MCITTLSDGTGLDKRGGDFLEAPGCVAVLGCWNGALGSTAEAAQGLCCHARAAVLSHSHWQDWSWHVNVPVLVLVAAFVCGTGLREGNSKTFSA